MNAAVFVQGAPFNIKDFKVLLDAQVYEDLEGRWVDLFNRMKWDIVKSVLKSVAGLQGRKFKVPAGTLPVLPEQSCLLPTPPACTAKVNATAMLLMHRTAFICVLQHGKITRSWQLLGAQRTTRA